MCVLVYKYLHQAAPTYLSELCTSVSTSASRSHLRSAARGDLAVPRSRTSTYGQRSFAVSGPTLWNFLPVNVHDSSLTLTQFCTRPKTVLFSKAYQHHYSASMTVLGCKACCAQHKCTYLLTYLLTAVERRSLAGELCLSCARPVAHG